MVISKRRAPLRLREGRKTQTIRSNKFEAKVIAKASSELGGLAEPKSRTIIIVERSQSDKKMRLSSWDLSSEFSSIPSPFQPPKKDLFGYSRDWKGNFFFSSKYYVELRGPHEQRVCRGNRSASRKGLFQMVHWLYRDSGQTSSRKQLRPTPTDFLVQL